MVAHLSNAGKRTLHVYVDSTAGVLPGVKDLARSWDQGRTEVHDMHDPGWSAVQHLRTLTAAESAQSSIRSPFSFQCEATFFEGCTRGGSPGIFG